LRQGEVETAVIAGLGGRNMVAMLETSAWLPRWLVLQPIQDADIVEAWIQGRRWPAVVGVADERGRRYRAWRVDVPRPNGADERGRRYLACRVEVSRRPRGAG
jgi:tRNA A22 N-methylase